MVYLKGRKKCSKKVFFLHNANRVKKFIKIYFLEKVNQIIILSILSSQLPSTTTGKETSAKLIVGGGSDSFRKLLASSLTLTKIANFVKSPPCTNSVIF